jgi:DNA-directed RNA polymerase II subunit RPB2
MTSKSSIKLDKQENKKSEYNDITIDDIFHLTDLYFYKKNYIYRHLYDSYNKFLEEDIPLFLTENAHVFNEKMTTDHVYRRKFRFKNVRIIGPKLPNGIEPMFPSDARHRNLTYSVKLIADIVQLQEKIDILTDKKEESITGVEEIGVPIATLPLMMRSKYCSLNQYKGNDKNECDFNPGGYFIVNGSEKIVICQERMVENKPLVFLKKDSGVPSYIVQVNSRSYHPNGMMQVLNVKIKQEGTMTIRVPILQEINVFILFRALGIQSDHDIINMIVHDDNDNDMIDILRISLDGCVNENGEKIQTVEQAYDYLINKLKVPRKYTETDIDTKIFQKKMHLTHLLKNSFIPHIDGGLKQKAYYLAYMINKLLKVFLGRTEVDDRDSYINKRIDLIGDLLMELFKQRFKIMMSDCKKYFDNRNENDEKPLNIINQIKPNAIEQGIKASLLTGAWIRKKGVAQMMQCYTYLQILGFLRRVDSPSGDASSQKLTGPRQLHASSIPFLCVVQTPEHAKVGVTKHFSLISTATIMSYDQYNMLHKLLSKKVKNLQDLTYLDIRKMFKVFLNGDWMGCIEEPNKLINELVEMKRKNELDRQNTSIVPDFMNGEIRIYCETGRFVRPVMRVENNNILVTKDIINKISLNKADKQTKITTWEELLEKYPDIIEYIDTEMQPYYLIETKVKEVEDMRKRMVKSLEAAKNVTDKISSNRYNELYFDNINYCEFHPQLLLGELSSCTPFCNRNPGSRNIFQYSQGRQAMGIYLTNYRDRTDISYILYHPQKPIVTTRAAKYVGSETLSAGENVMVAIMCYTGYNMEDSLIFNKASIDRGLFRSATYKGYESKAQKNQSTAQDDIFMKPDPTKVIGVSLRSYDKLNDKGYIPEETMVTNDDIIIGKVTPIQQVGNSNKEYKDSSTVYKAGAPGYVDRVYIDILDQDGHPTRKSLVRSTRTPKIGDKFACYTPDHDVLTTDGWISIDKLTTKHKVACLIDGKKLKYINPTEIQEFDCDEEIYVVESNQVNLRVTKNHRMYVGGRDTYKYTIEEAQDIFNKQRRYLKNCEEIEVDNNIEEIDNKFILYSKKYPEKELDIESFLTFFGIWMAEGCCDNIHGVQFAAHKPRVKEALQKICDNMEYKISKTKYRAEDNDTHRWSIRDKQLISFMKPFSVGAINKSLPDWVWELNRQQCKWLLNGLLLGDGHTMKNGTRRYDTSSTKLADDFQRLCLHAGYSTNKFIKCEAGYEAIGKSGNCIGKVIRASVDAYRLTIIESQNNPLVNKDKHKNIWDRYEHYTGKVYCCSVPTDDGVIYVRREGVVVWCGQSKYGQKGTCGIQLSGIDMPYNKYGIRPDIILNPHAIPSRQTVAQLLESLIGKQAILDGYEVDGTPFEDYDLTKVEKRLDELGYDSQGYEELYNGMTGEKLKVKIFMGPVFYQRLKHQVEDKIHCLTGDHDVLTLDGWKNIKTITMNDKVATLNNNELKYENPINVLAYPDYEGKVYRIKNQAIDLAVTSNHRMWISKVYGRNKIWKEYEFETADKLYGKFVKYKKDAEWNVNEYQFILPEIITKGNIIMEAKIVNMNSWLTFFGIWYAEGWASGNNETGKISIAINKQRIKDVIFNVFDNLNIQYHVSNEKLNTTNQQLYRYMKPLSVGAPNKKLPDWVFKLNKEQCKILLNSMILGDGSYTKSGEIYYSSSKILIDQFQQLCLHSGWACIISKHIDAGNKVIINNREVISNYDMLRASVIKTRINPTVNHGHTSTQNIQEETYIDEKCPVYCLEVPSEVFYVRRNGKAVWTGNSRARGPRTLLTRQPPEGETTVRPNILRKRVC